MAEKRKPLGRPLPPLADEKPPDEDERALLQAAWDTYAPKRYRGLLAAQSLSLLEATGMQPSGAWVWDDRARVYIRVRNGERVTIPQVRQAVDEFTRKYGRRRV